jgi:hypothetical protein
MTAINFLETVIVGLEKSHAPEDREVYLGVPDATFQKFTKELDDHVEQKFRIRPDHDQWSASYKLLNWNIHLFSNRDNANSRNQERVAVA